MSDLVTLCREALPRLQVQPLDEPETHKALYVPRTEDVLKKLETRLLLGGMSSKAKHVFSGHIGGGKSSELFNLKRELEREARATIIFFSVKKHVNLVGLDGTSLLEAIARALVRHLRSRNGEFGGFEERIAQARERYRRVRRRAENVKGGAGLRVELGVASAKAGLEAERAMQEEYVYESVSDPTAMLELVNEVIAEVRAKRGKGGEEPPPIVLFVDDLEKLDQRTAENVFSEGLALSLIDASVVFTVPISLLYSDQNRVY